MVKRETIISPTAMQMEIDHFNLKYKVATVATVLFVLLYVCITNHASRLVHVCRNDPDLKWLPQSMYYV